MSESTDFEFQNRVTVPLTETVTADNQRDVESLDDVRKTVELNTQRALDEAGFGKFNYKTVLVSGLICINVTFSITSLGFVMPSAACDFSMGTVDKGRISTSLISGMLCGLFVWNWAADDLGRKRALRDCLFLQAFAECAASLISNYWGFLVLKFLSGLAESGQITIVYTYAGEFQPTKYREKILGYTQIAFSIGVLLSPILAWFIIPLNIGLTVVDFSFRSWNLYVLLVSICPFLIGLAFLPLSETPKYLADTGRYEELYVVLTTMYCENTGQTSEEYLAKLKKANISFPATPSTALINNRSKANNFTRFFKTLYGQTGSLFKRMYIGRTLNLCIGTYLCFASLYSLMFWFAEIFNRFADFEMQHPGEPSDICVVSKTAAILRDSLRANQTSNNFSAAEPEICDSTIETSVYVNSLMLGLASIPTTIVFTLTVSRLGFRFYLAFNSFVCCAVTIGFMFVTSSLQNLIMSCIYSSFMTIAIAAIHCLNVELYPTNLRVSASALCALFGRIGAFVGNMTFGYLIDYHCQVMLWIVAVELFFCGLLAIFLTKGEQKSLKRQRQ